MFHFLGNPMAKNTYFISIHIGKFISAHFEQFYVSTFFPNKSKKSTKSIPNCPKSPKRIPQNI